MAFTVLSTKDTCTETEAYALYAPCMYRPTPGAYLTRARAWQQDAGVAVFTAYEAGEALGMLVVRRIPDALQIEGIAVSPGARGRGVGRALLAHVQCGDLPLAAQTDDDAVGFYRRCGFAVQVQECRYGQETVRRYHCIRTTQK